ncbi:hypothetical protein RHMOL_Rhmol13G0108500 [Rhododendron molle]|uniref:Uncharacterized protein n=1 Tax=Rhododendron molle TaxID=49168 RepID=A0ACC0L6W4_RHOML|nr:hypothetical protein RHMOL_Rhmol13G0108500 [Rhododendron molle]
MNGFVQQAFNMEVEGMARIVMSGFKPELVPVYTELANEFAVFDPLGRPSPTGSTSIRPPAAAPLATFLKKTIFDSLDENGLRFGISAEKRGGESCGGGISAKMGGGESGSGGGGWERECESEIRIFCLFF